MSALEFDRVFFSYAGAASPVLLDKELHAALILQPLAYATRIAHYLSEETAILRGVHRKREVRQRISVNLLRLLCRHVRAPHEKYSYGSNHLSNVHVL